jgi:hypothetical protein
VKAVFSPRSEGSFAWNGGAHKRWARVFRHGEWWWELGGDWGQGIVQGIVMAGPRLEVMARVDLSSPTAGGVSWTWVVDALARRSGVDGLGVEHDTQISVGLSRDSIDVSGRCVRAAPHRRPLAPRRATTGPCTVSWSMAHGHLAVSLDGERLIECAVGPCLPGLLMLGAGAHGTRESNARAGEVRVEWSEQTADRVACDDRAPRVVGDH